MEKEIIVGESGFAKQLAKNAGPREQFDGHPLWAAKLNYTKPTAVIQTHLDLLRIGAQIIYTNTYQATVDGYCEHFNLSKNQSEQLFKDTVELAHMARDRYLNETGLKRDEKGYPWIAGAIGSYGAHLHDGSEYTGDFIKKASKETIKTWHRKKITSIIRGDVDVLAIATIPCYAEAEIIAELLCKEFTKAKFWITFQCKDSTTLASGENFAETVHKFWNYMKKHDRQNNIVAIGVNCVHPENVAPLFKSVNGDVDINQRYPLIARPHSGECYDKEKGWIGTAVNLTDFIPDWIELGLKFVGGGCRTTIDEVPKIRKAIEDYYSKF